MDPSNPIIRWYEDHADKSYLREEPYGWAGTVGAVLGAVAAAIGVALALGMLMERMS